MTQNKSASTQSAASRSFLKPRALEPRVLFDAAAVETAVAVAAEAAPDAPAVDAAALFAAPATGRHEAYFVDTAVPNYQALLSQVPAGAEIFLINRDQPGLAQINAALAASGTTFDAIHLVSHGADGAIRLGNEVLTNSNLAAHTDALATLGSHLTSDGDLLLYGCDVASSGEGAWFLANLATLTGADVAASTDATGGPTGDADLEATAGTGPVTTDPWAAVSLLSAPLQLDGVYAGSEAGDASQPDQLGGAVDGSGEWIVGGGSGEVQAWKISGITRSEQRLTASGTGATFGQGVAIDGNTLVVGEPGRGTRGWIYIYQLNSAGDSWGLVRSVDMSTIPGIGGSAIGPWGDPSFGSSQWLAISGNHIAVGIPNEGSGGGGGQVAWIADKSSTGNWSAAIDGTNSGIFNEPSGADSNSHARFGASVALDEGLLVVGSPGYDRVDDSGYLGDDTGSYGSVFIYNWTAGSTGGPTTTAPAVTLVGENDINGVDQGSGVKNARFGAAVDIEYFNGKYTIVAGAPGEGNGEVYIYQTTSADVATIGAASNIHGQATSDDNFGLAVAVSQNRILVGAPNQATGETAVWFYQTPGDWGSLNTSTPASSGIYVKTFTASSYGGAGGDRFGRGLAFIQGNIIAAGAPLFSSDDRGAVAFFYARTPVAVNDPVNIGENAGATTINVLGNDIFQSENPATVPLTLLTATQTGEGLFAWNSSTRTFTFNPNGKYEYLSQGETGTATIKYTLTAQLGGVAFSTTATVTVTIDGANDAPQQSAGLSNITVPLTNEPNTNPSGTPVVSSGNITIPTNAFFDIDQSDILTYTLLSVTPVGGAPAAPAGFITFNGTTPVTNLGSYNNATGANTGNIRYNLTGMTANTSYVITIRASDGKGGTADTSFTFNVARANQNPEIVGGGVPNFTDAVEDNVFTKPLTSYFTDPDPQTGLYPESLTYTVISQTGPGPEWLTVSAAGTISGVASNDNVGLHTVVVRATDIFGNWIEDTFTVSVTNTNDAPVLTNDIDRKIAIRGETWGFNVTTGAVTWGGGGAPTDNPGPYFTDIDNSIADGRSPSSNDVITYRAYDALSGQEITASAGSSNAPWLRFNGTSFSGTPDSVLGKVITIRLDAIDRVGGAAGPIGGTTSTLFEIGVFPRDGASAVGTGLQPVEGGGRLGYDLAISSDNGRWMVVGEPGGNNGSGEIHIYENTAYATATAMPVWAYRTTFTTAATDARLGTSVDISADGRFIIAGAPLENNGAGAVYYYRFDDSAAVDAASNVWEAGHAEVAAGSLVFKGVSPDANAGDRFGSAVAINENGAFVLVGAPQDDEAGTNAGAAYMFGFGAATGSGKRLPTADTGEAASARAGDLYGSSVAFDQNMLVIGAPRDDHSGKADAGSAYVYSTDNTSFIKLIKSSGVNTADYFGTNVDVESFDGRNRVVVVVGTPNDDALATNAGAVYVYRSDGMVADNGDGNGTLQTLVQQSRVTAYDGDALENFGYSVAVDVEGDTATGALRMVVGGDLNGTSSGASYAFRYYALGNGQSGWVAQRVQPPVDPVTVNASNQYGFAVDIAGSRVIVGGPNADRSSTGAAGIYYYYNVAAGTKSPIETTPTSFSGLMGKELGTGAPDPVAVSTPAPAAFVAESWATPRLGELLRPVESWRLERPAANEAAAAEPLRGGEGIAGDLLFDLRTLKGKKLAMLFDPADPKAGVKVPVAPEARVPADKPVDAAPSGEDKVPAAPAPAAEAAVPGVGLGSQLQAVQGARARQQADRLLSSLSSLSA